VRCREEWGGEEWKKVGRVEEGMSRKKEWGEVRWLICTFT